MEQIVRFDAFLEIDPEKKIEKEEGVDTELDKDDNGFDKDFLEDDLEKYVDELDDDGMENDDGDAGSDDGIAEDEMIFEL